MQEEQRGSRNPWTSRWLGSRKSVRKRPGDKITPNDLLQPVRPHLLKFPAPSKIACQLGAEHQIHEPL